MSGQKTTKGCQLATREKTKRVIEASEGQPTLKSIAFLTGLGVTTVSRALKDGPEIGEDTKKRVRQIAKQIGYRPNRAGVRLRTGKTNVISLVLNTHEDTRGLVSEMVYGITEVLSHTPYHLVITPYSLDDAMEPVRYIVETRSADGLIISRTEANDRRVKYLVEQNFPFATHGRTDMGLVHAWHDFDNTAYGRSAVSMLAARGRKRIALNGPPEKLFYSVHTRAGFNAGIREFGLDEFPWQSRDVDSSMESIRQLGYEIGYRANRPDGVVCSSPLSALGLASGFELAGLKIGEDIDLVTKNTGQLLTWYKPEILTITEDFREAGRDLARAVLGRIEGFDPATLQHLVFPQ